MWKKIGLAIVILLILIAGAGYYLFSNLDSLVKAAIEKYGSEATQTALSVGGVSLSLTSGSGAITGLTIANPPGYSAANAVSLGGIALQLDTGSLAGNGPFVVDNFAITQPQITYEVKGLGQGSNLQTIQDNIQSFASNGSAGEAPAQGSAPVRKEIIRNLTITGGEVTVLAPALSGKTLVEPLPPLHLTDLGGSTGATPAQIGAQIVSAVINQAAATGATALINHQLGTKAIPPAAGSLLKGLFGG
jgi:hypothetical protein